MKKIVLFTVLLILIPMSQAEPLATSYWGYVTVDGITKPNALITLLDSSGNEIARTTSQQDATYEVRAPWDDPATPADEGVVGGETITFKVDGKTATSKAIDPKGSNNNIDLAVTSSSSSSSSGGGSSGGGGGGASAESIGNIQKKESREEVLSRNVPREFSFTTAELPVSQISITSNINAGLINVQVELLKGRSAMVKDDAPGDVYKYINIWVGTSGFAVPEKIKEAVIKFKLENAWITSKGLTEADITMLRWDASAWTPLATEKKSSDEKYTYYEAKTSAFSPFAISGVKGTLVSTAPQDVTAVTTETTEKTEIPASTKKAPGFGLVLAIAGLMAAVLRKRS